MWFYSPEKYIAHLETAIFNFSLSSNSKLHLHTKIMKSSL